MDEKQKYTVPQPYHTRRRLRGLISRFIAREAKTPPLSMEELTELSTRIISEDMLEPEWQGWIMVEINNCIWNDMIASIPYERRVVLMPKCLNNTKKCQAKFDDIGLLCLRCMNCAISELEEKADRLGVMSIVAEGFTSVIGLIENQEIDAVIGVGCLESLEKAFPLLINHAIPAVAIPLNINGCKDTNVDTTYVEEIMCRRSNKEVMLLDYDHLAGLIKDWFATKKLSEILSRANDPTSVVAREWLGGEGKRWRPYLLAATYMAISGNKDIPDEVRCAAVAVECFHKASLVHDDIQDNDTLRYGKPTINAAFGISIAINVGDLLLGEGYKLLTGCGHMELINMIATAHTDLCKGQGMELQWSRSPRVLTMDYVLEIFCLKTVPAFNVALSMGVFFAGNDPELQKILHTYSRMLGIAYQLQDDVEDFTTDGPLVPRPSAILAAIFEQKPPASFVKGLLACKNLKSYIAEGDGPHLLEKAIERVKEMSEYYHRITIEALQEVENVELKRLLFRVTKKILKPVVH